MRRLTATKALVHDFFKEEPVVSIEAIMKKAS
jgi:hypothetical protein